MLTCPACMRRCLRSTTGDLSRISISARNATSRFGRISTTRAYTSAAAKKKLSADSTSYSHKPGGKSISKSNTRQTWVESRGIRPIGKENSGSTNIIDEQTAKELRYLGDPLKLADHVRKRLQVNSKESFEEAQKLVRAASKNTQCVVSWNHLISWQLQKGSLSAALKTYNEVSASTLRM